MSEKKKNTIRIVIEIVLLTASVIYMTGSYTEKVNNIENVVIPRIEQNSKEEFKELKDGQNEILKELRAERDSNQIFRVESRMDRKGIHKILEKHIGDKQ